MQVIENDYESVIWNEVFSSLQEYEVLELLLTYALPRRDTKALAKNYYINLATWNLFARQVRKNWKQ